MNFSFTITNTYNTVRLSKSMLCSVSKPWNSSVSPSVFHISSLWCFFHFQKYEVISQNGQEDAQFPVTLNYATLCGLLLLLQSITLEFYLRYFTHSLTVLSAQIPGHCIRWEPTVRKFGTSLACGKSHFSGLDSAHCTTLVRQITAMEFLIVYGQAFWYWTLLLDNWWVLVCTTLDPTTWLH